ncbi:MAG TPA: hypothetical protein VFB28_13715 [Terriglobales bacterium]|jgi:hypothetical protein|nr:hypothetical protein [Terriglobales bacterium]
MSERMQFVEHAGGKILVVDFTDCTAPQVISIVNDVVEEVGGHPRDSVLILADFTRAQVDKPTAEHMKKALVMDRPYVKRAAWVGTETLPKVFFDNFKRFSQRQISKFASRQEAMDWLVGS